MEVTLPVYVQSMKHSGKTLFECRPLFHRGPATRHEHLRRAIEQLGRHVKKEMDLLVLEERHDALAAYHYFPPLQEKRLKLTLDMRDHLEKCRFLFVQMEALGRTVAFTPSIPELWFELDNAKSLEPRAEEVLTDYFLKQLKQDDTRPRPAEAVSLQGDAWVEHLDIVVRKRPVGKQAEERRQSLWGNEKMDGFTELNRVGRCLDSLYPDDLETAAGREQVVGELEKILRERDRRPVLLVGRRLTGKTAVIHEVVRRRVEQRHKPHSTKRNVWLLSPQRLVSGMSFVGQWEDRLLAILREAKRSNHVLYFDDLLGLYRAGISRDSSLSVADVLRTWIQDRAVRVLGEITPEALHALSERDRALVDDFHLLRIDETSEQDTLRIAIGEIRKLESRQHCAFDLDVLPTVISLQRRFVSDACFPGKAAKFLKQLAVKYQHKVIDRDHACREFHNQTGLSLDLLDDRQRLQRSSVIEWMEQRIIGQPEALEATADVVSLAKARLNAPDRPLATFVFLGPTGVGKTECAKTVAEHLFGNQNRLLRFDMNQYTTSAAVAQLTGTFDSPEGHLTSRVRHQPYSVVLLDEIEKAHPDVFDLLLQIMGEGRLTDSLGRTTDFTNTIVIMTSNLGVRDSQHQVGFGSDQQRQTFQRAAEQFFRPEFINRIDRVIPFARLSRAHIEMIAERLMKNVLQREGVVRRRCILDVDSEAMQSIIDDGYHPHLGARALKRSIESQLTTPLSNELSALNPDSPTVIQVLSSGIGLNVQVEELVEADRVAVPSCFAEPSLSALDALDERVDRCDAAIRELRPTGGLTAGQLTPHQLRYFAAEEQVILVRQMIDDVRDLLQRQPAKPATLPTPVSSQAKRRFTMRSYTHNHHGRSEYRVLHEINAANDIRDYFDELVDRSSVHGVQTGTDYRSPLGEAALLEAMAASMARSSDQRHDVDDCAVLLVRTLRSREAPNDLVMWRDVFSEKFQLDVKKAALPSLHAETALIGLSGPYSRLLAEAEQGVHLYCNDYGGLRAVQFRVLELADADLAANGEPDLDRVGGQVELQLEQWRRDLRSGRPRPSPFPLGRVLRIYQESRTVVDLRTGQTLASREEFSAKHRRLIAASFPLADAAGADDGVSPPQQTES